LTVESTNLSKFKHETAKRPQETDCRVSELLLFRHKQFTRDRLLELSHRLKPNVTVKFSVKAA
jgi:hypothetical protein